ncbi:hypothetical protein D3C76_1141240 [compost metagenome]
MFCPSESSPIPNTGARLERIKLTTGKTATNVFGNPSKEMIEPIMRSQGLNLGKTLIIGERLHTDISWQKMYHATAC